MNETDARHLSRMRKKAAAMLESVGAPPLTHPSGASNDLGAIDRMLDAMAGALGVELDADLRAPESPAAGDPWLDEVRAYLLSGHKIRAVKLYRDKTGKSLSDTVKSIEEIERNLR